MAPTQYRPGSLYILLEAINALGLLIFIYWSLWLISVIPMFLPFIWLSDVSLNVTWHSLLYGMLGIAIFLANNILFYAFLKQPYTGLPYRAQKSMLLAAGQALLVNTNNGCGRFQHGVFLVPSLVYYFQLSCYIAFFSAIK
jgi:hypothetical protein